MGTDHDSCSGVVNGMLSRSGTRNDVRGFSGITGGCDWAVRVATILLLLKVYLGCE